VLTLDGRGTLTLLVPVPIVEVTKIEIIDWPVLPGGAADVSLDAVAIYNRHLVERLTNPDDRKNPRITWTSTKSGRRTVFVNKWPEGVRNIRLTGRFGYTEYDGLIPNYGCATCPRRRTLTPAAWTGISTRPPCAGPAV
jgi:hypothetical protein